MRGLQSIVAGAQSTAEKPQSRSSTGSAQYPAMKIDRPTTQQPDRSHQAALTSEDGKQTLPVSQDFVAPPKFSVSLNTEETST